MNKTARLTMRRGDMSPVVALALISLVAVFALAYFTLMLRPGARRSKSDSLEIRVYCASGVVEPVSLALQSYRAQFDIDVSVVRTGGSGKLFGQIETEFQSGVTRGADIYVSADESLVERGQQQGVIDERIPMAIQRPVIATHVDSVYTAAGLSQMVASQDDLRFGIANESAAIGRLARDIAEHEGVLNELLERRKLETENVMQLAQALQTKTVDAAVIWDATVTQVNRQHGSEVLKIVARPETPSGSASGRVTLGIVGNTPHPTAALRVGRFLTARDGGLPFLEDAGFEVVDGDRWEEVPEIHLYCGSMFNPVFDRTVQEFAQREGVNIYSRWEGCGKLVAAMDSIAESELFPDVFLACDRNFMSAVGNKFDEPLIVSANDLVLAIRRDVPIEIRSPIDLLNDRLRVGLCHPEDSALGKLTKELMSQPPFDGLHEKLSNRASVIADVGPTLVSQLLSGGLDVAVVYRSNVMADPSILDELRIVPIGDSGLDAARAVQSWAISRDSDHKQMMSRLLEALVSAESQSQFDAAGFQWLYRHRNRETGTH